MAKEQIRVWDSTRFCTQQIQEVKVDAVDITATLPCAGM